MGTATLRRAAGWASFTQTNALVAALAACCASVIGSPARAQPADAPAAADAPAETAATWPATSGEGLLRNEPGAYQGYTLISPLLSKSSFLIDMEGRVVKTWQADSTPGSLAYLLENGNLLRGGEAENPPWGGGPASSGLMQEFAWDGNLVWDFAYMSDDEMPHHDYARMPNGNLLWVVKERRTAEESIVAGRVPASVEGDRELQVDTVVEIRPTGPTTGEVVWRWRLWDHLIQDHDPEKANYGDVAAHPELVDFNFDPGIIALARRGRGEADGGGGRGDGGRAGARRGRGRGRGFSSDWTHVNAINYNADLDQIILSVNRFSEIWIIDHSTTTQEAAGHTGGRWGRGGDLLYRWGNPVAYRAGTEADRTLFSQHDAQWIAPGLPGAGHLLVYNNGNNREPGVSYSTVDELVPPVDAEGRYVLESGGKYGPEEPVWRYAAENPRDFYSNFISGAQRLPNGNTLICSGANGILFEVTPDKQVVWQYNNPNREELRRQGGGQNGRSVFRAFRYGPDYPGLVGKELMPGRTLVELAEETRE